MLNKAELRACNRHKKISKINIDALNISDALKVMKHQSKLYNVAFGRADRKVS